MGGNLQTAMCHLSGAATRMHIPLTLLCAALMAAAGSTSRRSRRGSIRNTIYDIKNMVQTTQVHIKLVRRQLSVFPLIEVSTPSIDGLSSISHELGLLDIELQNPFTRLASQVQADVSSLEGRVRALAQILDCPVQSRPSGEAADNQFPESQLYLTLTKVQLYMEMLLLKEDKLKVC
ncbi:leptin-B [Hippoglossus stenolepis]|uniref:leptin-B n=1 Tax=Hippoglossus stenolepis TaxID=195615 RepID=UPI00159C78A4|nr:leptin-B [Hippoglossus stenolepis]